LKIGLIFDPRPQGKLGYKIYDQNGEKPQNCDFLKIWWCKCLFFSRLGTKINFGIFLSYPTSNMYINLTLPPEQNNIHLL
jgi:hypothetical protein